MTKIKMFFIIIGIIYTISSIIVSPQIFTFGGSVMVFGPFLSAGNSENKVNENPSFLIGGLILLTLALLLVCNILMWVFILLNKNVAAIISMLIPVFYGIGLFVWFKFFV